MRGPKGYSFSGSFVINRVTIFNMLAINRVWFLHTSLDLERFLRKSLIMFRETVRESKFWSGDK